MWGLIIQFALALLPAIGIGIFSIWNVRRIRRAALEEEKRRWSQ